MSLFLGPAKCIRHEGKEVVALQTGPGGLVVGCLSRDFVSSSLELSIWIVLNGGVICLESLDLHHHGVSGAFAGGLQWHPSGGMVYVLTGSEVVLLTVEWGDLYQDNRQVSLTEFYSLFLAERQKDVEEGGFYGVNLAQSRVLKNVTATSMVLSSDLKQCIFGGFSPSDSMNIMTTTADLKNRQFYSLPKSAGTGRILEKNLSVSFSHVADNLNTDGMENSLESSFRLCKDNSALDLIFGYIPSSNAFLVMKFEKTGITDSVALKSTMLVQLKSSESRSRSVLENEEREVEEDEKEDDNNNDDDDEEEEEEEEEKCAFNTLDDEIHGDESYSDRAGKICDVVCLEVPEVTLSDKQVNCNESVPCIFYCILMEFKHENEVNMTHELILVKLEGCNFKDRGKNSFSLHILSRFGLKDTYCSFENSASRGNRTVQIARQSSYTLSGLVIQLCHSIQYVPICGLALHAAAIGYRCYQHVFQSPTFTVDMGRAMTIGRPHAKFEFSLTSETLLISCERKGGDEEKECMCNDIYSVSLLSLLNCSHETMGNGVGGIALLNISDGKISLFGKDGLEDESGSIDERSGTEKGLESDMPHFVLTDVISSGVKPAGVDLPITLVRDLVMSRCSNSILTKKNGDATSALNVCDDLQLLGGLVGAISEYQDIKGRRYMASAISVSPEYAVWRQLSPSYRHNIVNHSYIWVQSIITSKWKILRIPSSPTMPSIRLLAFQYSSSESPSKLYPSKKHYCEKENVLLGLLNIGWFADHTIYMCTARRQTTEEDIRVHCCLELMSRASDRSDSVTVEHNRYRNGRRDLRRVSTPNAHCVVPLPSGFVPIFVDCTQISSDVCPESCKSRSVSASSIGVEDYDDVELSSSSCIIIVGNSSGVIIALRVQAIQHGKQRQDCSEDEILEVLKPSKYRVATIWQCHLHHHTPTAVVVAPIIRSAQVVVHENTSFPLTPADVGLLVVDVSGQVIKISITSSDAKRNNVCDGDSTIFEMVPALVASRSYNNALRVKRSNLSFGPRMPLFSDQFENSFLLISSLGEDVLYLPASRVVSADGRLLKVPPREVTNTPLGSINALWNCSLSATVWCIPSHRIPDFEGSDLRLQRYQNCDFQPSLYRKSAFQMLSVMLGLFEACADNDKAHSDTTGPLLLPYYKYEHDSVVIVQEIIHSLKLCNNDLLWTLSDGIESHLKTIIQKSNFSRHQSNFAIIVSALFAADDEFFIDILSKLARKLEPHIRLTLFPLPNCQISQICENENIFSDFVEVDVKREIRKKYFDSFWDQLAVFEFCLHNKSLVHASRFLTVACEQLGGSQCIETVTANLVIATELLFQSLTHLNLETALECLDFCVRLDLMATELVALRDRKDKESQQELSTTSAVVNFVQHEVIEVMGLLSPLFGSDLHDVLEDVVQPRNERNLAGILLYGRPVYKHPKVKYRFDKSPVPKFLCFDTYSEKYFAFCAANCRIEQRIHLNSHHFYNVADVKTLAEHFSPISYTSTIIQLVVEKYVLPHHWLCASVMMSSIQQHSLASSRQKISWIENGLYYKSIQFLDQQSLSADAFENFHVYQVLKSLRIPPSTLMLPSSALDDDINEDIRIILLRVFEETELAGMCDVEIIMPDGVNENLEARQASNSDEDVRSMTLFALPESSQRSLSMISLIRGTAAAALLSGRIEVVLFVAIFLCKRDIVRACLGWNDRSCRQFVIDFVLSRSSRDFNAEFIPNLSSRAERLFDQVFGPKPLSLLGIAKLLFIFFDEGGW